MGGSQGRFVLSVFKLWGNTRILKFAIFAILKCITRWHLAHSQHCVTITTVYNQNLSIILNKNSVTVKQGQPHYPSHRPLETSILFSVSMNLPILGTSCKWNLQYLSFYVWLISLNLVFSRFIRVTACNEMPFLFWLNESHCVYIPCFVIHRVIDTWVVSTL